MEKYQTDIKQSTTKQTLTLFYFSFSFFSIYFSEVDSFLYSPAGNLLQIKFIAGVIKVIPIDQPEAAIGEGNGEEEEEEDDDDDDDDNGVF